MSDALESSSKGEVKSSKQKGKGKGKQVDLPEPPEPTPVEREFKRKFGMDRKSALLTGVYTLSGHHANPDSNDMSADSGTYTFDDKLGQLSSGSIGIVGTFSALQIREGRSACSIRDVPAETEMHCVEVINSEIMKEIQDVQNAGAYFVLPSQLNGAEYPSHEAIISKMDDYKFDNTGGPRGQLAVHPAAGQFLLDNAANLEKTTGINAVDYVLQRANDQITQNGYHRRKDQFQLVNGYLKVPRPENHEAATMMLEAFEAHVHGLRCLLMKDVPACGLMPDKRGFSTSGHTVSLVYASAVPLKSYVNGIGSVSKTFNDDQMLTFQTQIAELVLVAQYCGALKAAASKPEICGKVKVFLMPLGGGVFRNSWESIVRAMAVSIEALDQTDRDRLDIKALAFKDGKSVVPESQMLTELLRQHRKLI